MVKTYRNLSLKGGRCQSGVNLIFTNLLLTLSIQTVLLIYPFIKKALVFKAAVSMVYSHNHFSIFCADCRVTKKPSM